MFTFASKYMDMNHFKRIIFVAALGMVAVFMSAQSVRFFPAGEMLSNSLTSQIYQDSIGYVWIGTSNGLNRYDGNKVTVYRHEEANDRSLLYDKVLCVNNDAQGRLLIGTRKQGLQQYNYDTDDFTTIPIASGNTGISQICTSPDGQTYIVTVRYGVVRLSWRGQQPVAEPLRVLPEGATAEQMAADAAGRLWFISKDRRVYCSQGGALAQPVTADGEEQRFTRVFAGSGGDVFAGTEDGSLFRFNAMRGQLQRLTRGGLSPVSDIQQADARHLYLGTDGDGIRLVDVTTGAVGRPMTNASSLDLSHEKVTSICVNRQGDLWMAAFRRGVFFCPRTTYGFQLFRPSAGMLQGRGCYVTALTPDTDGGLWMAVEENGLFHFDAEGNVLMHLSYRKDGSGLPADVMSLLMARDGRLWVGAFLGRAGWVDTASGDFHPITAKAEDGPPRPLTHVNGIAEGTDGTLWMSTVGNGLIHYHPASGKVSVYNTSSPGEEAIPSDYLQCVALDAAGRVFFGTGNGVGCLDVHSGSFTSVFGRNNIFDDVPVNCICFDRHQRLWAGSDEGLLCYDIRTRMEQRYTTADGLPSNAICGIQQDANGRLWLSTLMGLVLMTVDGDTPSFRRYYAADGLQGNEFSKTVSAVSADGVLFFGGMNGATAFRPGDIQQANSQLTVTPSELLMGSEPVTTLTRSGGRQVIDSPITEARQVRLSYDDASFSLGFTTFSYAGGMGITYYYQIDDGQWLQLPQGSNHVSFTHLSPGRYQLKVKAQLGEVESSVRQISIVITPPWYSSWWAWLIYLAAAGLLGYFFIRRYRERQEEKLNEVRLRFFTDISHDIRTPMTLIISPLDGLLKDTTLSADVHKTLQLMQANANRILELVNQLLTIRKVDRDQMRLQCRETDVVAYLKQAYRMFESQARAHKVKLSFLHDMDELLAWVDTSFLDKVINNLLGNAFKYTPEGGSVSLRLSLGVDEKARGALSNYFQVEVVDTGQGLDPQEIPHLFERFYRSRHSLAAGGTGIGLNLCEALITRHHGVIAAENRGDGQQGSRFYFRLPLGMSYLLTEEMAPAEEESPAAQVEKALSTVQNMKTEKRNNKSGFRLLIIDDDADIRDYLASELGRNYTIVSASNGRDGLQLALSRMPDLVICDVMMPDMDGYEFVKTLKHNPNINDIPVILLTAKGETSDRIEGLGRGADAYMVKPFHMDELNTQIRNLISNRQRLRGKYSGSQEQAERVEEVEMQSGDEQFIERVMQAVNRHMNDRDYHTEQLASDVGVSRVHLNRKMKELTGVSPGEFMRNLRLKQAAKLLLEKKSDISQIAYSCGFASISVFSAAFKKIYGMSPTAYIENNDKTK